MPQINVSRREFECIVDALKGTLLKCQTGLRASLISRLEYQPPPNPKGWAPGFDNGKLAPLRSAWPDNPSVGGRRRNWSHHKPRTPKASKPKAADKPPMSAQEYLDSIV